MATSSVDYRTGAQQAIPHSPKPIKPCATTWRFGQAATANALIHSFESRGFFVRNGTPREVGRDTMTQDSKRNLERKVDDLDSTNNPDVVVTITNSHVMEREKAEAEGREVIDEADGPQGSDLVVVGQETETYEM